MTVADSGSPGWLEQNALDRHPDSADVDAILRRLKADGVNFIVGCVYHDGGEAIIEVRGILLPSHRSDETRRPLTHLLSRQARDRHRESTEKSERCVFLTGAGAVGLYAPRRCIHEHSRRQHVSETRQRRLVAGAIRARREPVAQLPHARRVRPNASFCDAIYV
jgi:hypothetical protein